MPDFLTAKQAKQLVKLEATPSSELSAKQTRILADLKAKKPDAGAEAESGDKRKLAATAPAAAPASAAGASAFGRSVIHAISALCASSAG